MALWSLIAPRLSLVWQIALVTILSFLYGVLLDYSYGLLFKSGLTFVVSGLLYVLIMQYRRFYSIHLFSLFLGDF